MEINTVLIKVYGDGTKEYTVNAREDLFPVHIGTILITKKGHFELIMDRCSNNYEENENIILKEIEKLLREKLIGKEITASSIDDDLANWLDENDKPLIVEGLEIESHGIWIEGCDYRIDMDEYSLVI